METELGKTNPKKKIYAIGNVTDDGDGDDGQGLIQELQLLSLENNTLKAKISHLEKQRDEFL